MDTVLNNDSFSDFDQEKTVRPKKRKKKRKEKVFIVLYKSTKYIFNILFLPMSNLKCIVSYFFIVLFK